MKQPPSDTQDVIKFAWYTIQCQIHWVQQEILANRRYVLGEQPSMRYSLNKQFNLRVNSLMSYVFERVWVDCYEAPEIWVY